MVTNDKDHLCTQVSYRLNLRGPERCRADHLLDVAGRGRRWRARACRRGRCDMALAGGVTVRVPQRGGYFYVAGSILSPDGHCRPFDAKAQGTIVGSGVGLVCSSGSPTRWPTATTSAPSSSASASTTTATTRSGYTAPSVRGQAAAIARRIRRPPVISPDTIGYVEAHGTGTILGDPDRAVGADARSSAQHTDRRGFCGIGSAKSNFGHLSCAAGVTGLIKTVLALEHGAIPPTVHYECAQPGDRLRVEPVLRHDRAAAVGRATARRAAPASARSASAAPTRTPFIEEAPPPPTAPATSAPHQAAHALGAEPGRARRGDQAAGRTSEAHPDAGPGRRGIHAARRAARVPASPRARRRSRRARRRRRALLGRPERLPASEAGRRAEPSCSCSPARARNIRAWRPDSMRASRVVRDAIDHAARPAARRSDCDLRTLLFPAATSASNADGRSSANTALGAARAVHRGATRWPSCGAPGASSLRR